MIARDLTVGRGTALVKPSMFGLYTGGSVAVEIACEARRDRARMAPLREEVG